MSPRPFMHLRIGSLMPVLALAVAGSAITLATLAAYGVFPARSHVMETPTAEELEATLMRVGLSAATLTAAGCRSADATEVGRDAAGHLDASRWAALQAADQAVRDARASVDRLGRLVRAGQASDQDRSDYTTAQSTLASAESTRDGLLEDLFTAATEDLDQAEVTLLETMHGNAGRPVPLEYTLAERTDADWTSLRDAMANLKVSDKCGEEPHSGCEQLVAACDAEPAVATASANLDAHLATVTSAYQAALGY